MPLAPHELRIGLLIDSFQQPLWVAKMLEEIVGSEYAEISLLIVNDRDLPPAPVERRGFGLLGKLAANREHLLYTLYNKLEAWRGIRGIDAFEPVSITECFSGCPTISVKPRMTKFCDYFEDADVDAILEHDLDVALRLGFRILKGRALQIARFGIWSYHHGDNLNYRGGPPAFWEVAENRPITGSILQILTEQLDNGAVLNRLSMRVPTACQFAQIGTTSTGKPRRSSRASCATCTSTAPPRRWKGVRSARTTGCTADGCIPDPPTEKRRRCSGHWPRGASATASPTHIRSRSGSSPSSCTGSRTGNLQSRMGRSTTSATSCLRETGSGRTPFLF
jgi:hypothetical protein